MRLAVVLILALTGSAAANQPLERAYDDEERPSRPALEWSTWFRLGFGMAPADAGVIARSTLPPSTDRGQVTIWDAAIGIDLTAGLTESDNVRLGPWLEVRGLHAVGGIELVVQRLPKELDLFHYTGQGVLVLRAGGNHERATGQVAYGYLAPWSLFRTPRGATRYMIGVRFVASYTRALDDPRDWSASIGIETEPFGALRYLLGLSSLY